MKEKIIIAGFGGQGVIMAGKLIAYAGMLEGKFVSHIPSYGVEMRGGTANCSVVISDIEVASPLVPHPTTLIAMNQPSLDKFEKLVVENGHILVNSSLRERYIERTCTHFTFQPITSQRRQAAGKRQTSP